MLARTDSWYGLDRQAGCPVRRRVLAASGRREKMRLLEMALLGCAAPLAVGCGPACAQGDERGEEARYTLELSGVTPGDPAIPLTLSNDTLAFPLAVEDRTQLLTDQAPGDLVIAYTRVGCWIDDPEQWIGQHEVRDVPPVHLREVTIEQVSDTYFHDDEPRGLSEGSCFTYRTCDGVWHPLLGPTEITAGGGRTTATLAIDVDGVDAAAIFLPLYTRVSRVTYTAE
jgi:hypothetical protein